MTEKKRIIEVDIAKGILIFLVILGHSPIEKWLACGIGSFHMAAFFCLSGFTYRFNGDFKQFIGKKTQSLIIPYLLFSVILLMLATVKRLAHIGLNNFDIVSGIESIFVPYHGREQTTVYYLWFLPCLYVIEITLAFSQWISLRYKNLIGMLFVLLFSLICILIYRVTQVASIISIYPIGLLFLLLGMWIKPFYSQLKSHAVLIAITSFFLLILMVYGNMSYTDSIDLSCMHLGRWPLYLLSCTFGSILILSVSALFSSSLIRQIGCDSIYYYGLHYCIIWFIDNYVGGLLCAVATIAFTYPIILIYKLVYSHLSLPLRKE